jgi:hypothetical protein
LQWTILPTGLLLYEAMRVPNSVLLDCRYIGQYRQIRHIPSGAGIEASGLQNLRTRVRFTTSRHRGHLKFGHLIVGH